jgi:hypothetical protein
MASPSAAGRRFLVYILAALSTCCDAKHSLQVTGGELLLLDADGDTISVCPNSGVCDLSDSVEEQAETRLRRGAGRDSCSLCAFRLASLGHNLIYDTYVYYYCFSTRTAVHDASMRSYSSGNSSRGLKVKQ